MFNMKRLFIAVIFILLMFFLMTFGGYQEGTILINTRNVKFIDEITSKVIDEQDVEVGKSVKMPNAPYHKNYVFDKWVEQDTGKEFDKDSEILEDEVIIADFDDDINNNKIPDDEDTYYNVVFYDTISEKNIKTQKVLVGLSAKEPSAPKHDGYTFVSWDKAFNKVSSNLKVNTKYDKDSYEITFENENGDDNTKKNYEYGDVIEFPVNISKTYVLSYSDSNNIKHNNQTVKAKLLGWCKNAKTCSNPITTAKVTEKATYYAVWGNANSTLTVDSASSYNTKTTNYKFTNWIIKDNTLKYDKTAYASGSKITLKGNTNLTASYDESLAKYKLTINYNFENGKKAAESKTVTVEYGKQYEVSTPNVKGYTPNNSVVSGTMGSNDKNVEVVFKANEHKISFHNNNKEVVNPECLPEDIIYTYEEKVSLEDLKMTSDSHNFIGWVDKDGKPVSEIKTGTDNDTEVYAKWEKKKFDVVVDPEDGEDPKKDDDPSGKHEYGDEITLPTITKKATLSYKVDGGTKPESVTKYFTLKGYCKNSKSCKDSELVSGKVTVTDNVTYYAIFSKDTADITVANGENYQTETTNYTFTNWKITDNKLGYTKTDYNSGNTIKLLGDTTLTAQYSNSVREYKLTINYKYKNGDEAAESKTIKVKNGFDYTVTSPVINGYTANYDIVTGTMGTEDKIVDVIYDINTYKLSFKNNENVVNPKGLPSDINYTIKDEISLVDKKMTSDSHNFNGWVDKDGNPVTKITLGTTGNTEVYASWTIKEFDVVIDPEDGEDPKKDDDPSGKHEYGDEIILPTITKKATLSYKVDGGTKPESVTKYFTLKGYCKNSKSCKDSELVSGKVTVTDNVTYYAIFSKDTADITVANGENYQTETTNYTFTNWKITDNKLGYTKTEYNGGNTIKLLGDTTLTAQYSNSVREYKLTINYKYENGDEAAESKTIKVKNGIGYSVDSPTKNGYTASQTTVSGTMGTEDKTVDVTYTINTYTLTFTNNENVVNPKGQPNPINYTIKENVTLSDKVMTSDSHNFLGWYDKDGNKVTEITTGTYENTEVFAKWEKKKFKVEIDPEGGDIPEGKDPSDDDYEYGNEITLPATTKKATLSYKVDGGNKPEGETKYFTLKGYCKDSKTCSDEELVRGTVKVTDNVKYYAIFSTDTEEITIKDGSNYETDTTVYTFTKWSIVDNVLGYTKTDYNSGNTIKLLGDTTLTAQYSNSVREYKLTINYKYENGDVAAESKTIKVKNGFDYTVTSPTINGYTASQTTVSGTMETENKTVDVTYTINTYTLTFTNDENVVNPKGLPSDINYTIKENVTLSDKVMTSDSHNFLGWYDKDGNKVTEITTGTYENTEVFAKWEKKKFKVEIDPKGGDIPEGKDPSDDDYEYGNEITLPSTTKKATLSYKVDGGNKPEGETKYFTLKGYCKDSETCSDEELVSGTVEVTDNVKYYAIFSKDTADITVANGENYQTETTVYTFTNWKITDNKLGYTKTEYNGGNTIKLLGDTTLTAQYSNSVREYKLTINYKYENDDVAAESKIIKVKNGFDYTVTSPTINGYTASQTTVSGTMGTEDKTVNVVYKINNYKVSFKNNENVVNPKGLPSDINYTIKENVTLSDKVMTSDSHNFLGWYDKDGNKVTEITTGTYENTEVFAKWEKKKFKVEIDPEGGDIPEGTNPSGNNYEYGNEITLPATTKKATLTYKVDGGNKPEGETKYFTLKGYCKNSNTCSDEELVSGNVEVTDNVKYYAIFSADTEEITIKDGSNYETDTTVYTFTKWSISSITSKYVKTDYVKGDKIKLLEDTTLAAQYNSSVRKYTLTINYKYEDDTKASNSVVKNVENGSKYSIASPTINGYTADKTTVSGTMPTENKTVDVKYTINTYTLTFKNNENVVNPKGLPSDINYTIKENVTLSDKVMTSDSHNFLGWYDKDGNKVTEITTGTYENTEVFAKWEKKKFKVEIDPEGGVIPEGTNPSGNNYEYGNEITLPATTKDATLSYKVENGKADGSETRYFTLKGYCKDSKKCSDEELVSGTVTVTDNVKYYAIFSADTEEITIKDGSNYETDTTVYTFTKWSISSITSKYVKTDYVKGDKIKLVEDTDLDAQYTSETRKYTLTINYKYAKDDSSASNSYVASVDNGASYNVDSPTITGYTADKTTVSGTMPTENKTVDVKYTANEYELTFKNNNNHVVNPKGLPDKITYTVEDTISFAKKVMTSDSHDFVGWVDKDNKPISSIKLGTAENTEVYASWEEKEFEIIIEKEGGTISEGSDPSKNDYNYGDKFTLPSITKYSTLNYTVKDGEDDGSVTKAYRLKGYCKGSKACLDIQLVTGEVTVTGDAKYYAIFEEKTEAITVKGGKNYSVVDTDYTFTNWSISSITDKYVKKDYVENETIELLEDTTLAARYNSSVRKYTITWNNYDNTELSHEDVAYGTTPVYNGETPTRESSKTTDYTFNGWTPGVEKVSGEATYTATFKETARKYKLTIEYVFVDGSKALDSYVTKIANGEEYKINTPELVKDGITFNASLASVSGTMPTEDVKKKVVFTTIDLDAEQKIKVNAKEDSDNPVIVKYDDKVDYIIELTNEGTSGTTNVKIEGYDTNLFELDRSAYDSDEDYNTALAILNGGSDIDIDKSKKIEIHLIVKGNAGEEGSLTTTYCTDGYNYETLPTKEFKIEKPITVIETTKEYVGTNIVIVIDNSSSMYDSVDRTNTRMSIAKSALKSYLNSLYSNGAKDTDVKIIDFYSTYARGDRSEVIGSTHIDTTTAENSATSSSQLNELIENVNDISKPFAILGVGTPYYKGLEAAYEALYGTNGLAVGNNKENVVIFVTDGNPEDEDYTDEVENLINKGTHIFAIAYSNDISKNSDALLKVTNNANNIFDASLSTDSLTAAFEKINAKINTETYTKVTVSGGGEISGKVEVTSTRPFVIYVNGTETVKYTSIEDALTAGDIYESNGKYYVNVKKYGKTDTIKITYYISEL